MLSKSASFYEQELTQLLNYQKTQLSHINHIRNYVKINDENTVFYEYQKTYTSITPVKKRRSSEKLNKILIQIKSQIFFLDYFIIHIKQAISFYTEHGIYYLSPFCYADRLFDIYYKPQNTYIYNCNSLIEYNFAFSDYIIMILKNKKKSFKLRINFPEINYNIEQQNIEKEKIEKGKIEKQKIEKGNIEILLKLYINDCENQNLLLNRNILININNYDLYDKKEYSNCVLKEFLLETLFYTK